jgi:hypothetical protein
LEVVGNLLVLLVFGALAGSVASRVVLVRRLRSRHPEVWTALGKPTAVKKVWREWTLGLSKLIQLSAPATLEDRVVRNTIRFQHACSALIVVVVVVGLLLTFGWRSG